MHHPPNRITHTTAFVTPMVEHWLKREIAQWVHHKNKRSDHPSYHERTIKSKIVTFRKARKLKPDKRWTYHDSNSDILHCYNYFGIWFRYNVEFNKPSIIGI